MRNWVWTQQCGKRGLDTTPVGLRRGLAAVPVGGGRARPGSETTHPAGSAGVKGAGGTCRGADGRWWGLAGLRATRQHARHRRCGGRRRDLPRCRWAVAGPGRASPSDTSPARLEAAARPAGPGRASRRRAERSSRRGRRAGGQAARRPEICRGNEQGRTSGGATSNANARQPARAAARSRN